MATRTKVNQPRTTAAARRARPAGRRSARRWPLVAGLAALAVASAGVAFGIRDQGGGVADGPTATGSGGVAVAAADFGHVHGLAVDHATGGLYAATHVGLFRIDGEHTAARVSQDTPDLMGFTSVGQGHFLASGHPGEDGKGPGNLGLIESTDGGVTWQNTSLAGAADFHGLRAAHGKVYGYNSADGAFMVSTDHRTWERRSTLALGAFAVSPTDPQTVIAVGRDGLQRSTDGGRSWAVVGGAPAIWTLTWDEPAYLWGAAADGGVWQSTDGGTTWKLGGRLPAQPQALATHGSTLFAAVAGDEILTSTDGAVTWTVKYSP
ncbi:hypothetical protein GCM10009682_28010 [Luedemannella flava]|uniref:Exo-alpha-sialidase n=1 Tax=Luedemannella flava TaxID=349316 RepID=A0ABN2M0F2_9ACTN